MKYLIEICTDRMVHGLVRALALAVLGALSLVLVPAAAAELPAGLELRFELAPAAPLADPPLPPPAVFPVQLVLDDDSAEGTVGVADANGAREFLWFNRFTPSGEPFDLAEVWVLFPTDSNVAPGDAVQIAVYLDPDGDPTNGADLLATFAETVQVADGNTFSIYPLVPPVPIHDPGDVLIGVVPRFLEPGDPPTAPAAVDTTASQQRSWIAIWTADPPDPPELPPDLLIDLIDDVAPAAAGNWMIRGFGVGAPAVVIPALDGIGLGLLALALGAAGFVALRRLRRRAAGIAGLIALAAAAALAPSPASAQVVIDELSTLQGPVSDPPGGGSTAVTGGADILGGKRGLLVRNLAGAGPTSIEVAGGTLDFSVNATTPDSAGEADVIWDGDVDNDPHTFDPTGFTTPVDLTDGGTQGAIRITVEQAQAGTHLVLAIYQDANQVSRAGRVLPAIASTTDVFIPFSELIADPDAIGPADLTQVGAITLRIGGRESASPPVLSISHIETAGPDVAAAKVDTVGGVIVAGPQTPGTTLRYRVTIDNPGAGAAEGVEFDDVVTDPNLGPPAAIRATPLARRDQYVTFTDGPIDSAVDGVPSLLANDVDVDGDPLAAVPANGVVTAQGGSVDVLADGHFVYTPPAGYVGVDAFDYTIAATAGDPTADAAGNPIGPIQSIAFVTIDRVPPEITAGGTLAYTENDPPTAIDPALTVVDVDSANLFGATVEISANYVPGEDVLGFMNTPNITGVFVPATGVLTLTGTDTVAAYQAALRSVTYENTSEDPSELDRTVTWTATDGGETSAPATSTIEVTAVNDAPIVTTSAGTTSFTEDGGPVVVDSALTVTDADDTNLASATVTITNLLDAGLETLAANTGGTSITAVYAAPTLTLTGSDTLANYQQVLRSVTYDNASQDPTLTDRIVRFVANDGTDPSAPADKTVTVTPQNDPPVAADDVWHTIGNTQLNVDPDVGDPAITTPHVLDTTPGAPDGVRDNDADPVENDNHMVTGIVGCADPAEPFDCPTANGGTVSLEADGSFTYTPAPGDAAASDSFQYILTDDGFPAPASDMGTVTIQRFERVWYVDNDFGAGGNGTSASPFNTLTALNGAGGAGDSDSPNDYIFVHFGDGTATGQTAGLVLENGQHLLGEHAGLSIPVNLNGNGSPTVLHAGTPGSRPLISHTGAGNSAVSAGNAIPAAIRGLRLSSAAESAIDITTLAAFAGSGTLAISDNVIDAGLEGLDLNHAGTGAITLALHDNTVNSGTRGLDVARSGSGSLTITRFDDNVVHGNVTGSGIEIAGALFDATPGLPVQQVSGGVTTIGQGDNPVGTHGLLLNGVTGDLAFTDLDVFNNGGTGLQVASTGMLNAGAGTGFRILVPPGVATIDATGPAVDISNASVTLPVDFLRSQSSPTTGLSLVNAFGGVGQVALSADVGLIQDGAGASGTAVHVSGGNGHVLLDISITNNSGQAITISSRTSDTVAFTGSVSDTGSGISLSANGASASTVFAGGLAMATGSATAFSAVNGGRLTICDENPCNPGATGPLVNALETVTATALNLSNTTITPDGVTLRRVNSVGASANPGIILAGTGSGPFQVTGTGGEGTGGSINNKTADAMRMSNTGGPVTLRGMNFLDIGNMSGGIDTVSGHDAIHGENVLGGLTLDGVVIRRISDNAIHGGTLAGGAATVWNGLTLNNVTIEDSNRFHVANAGDSNNEGMVRILGIRGPVSITNSTLRRGGELVDFFVNGGALSMTATNNDFHYAYKEFTSGSLASIGGHCIDVTLQNDGDASIVLGDRTDNALDNDFLNCRIGSVRVIGDAGYTGDADVVIGQNEFTVDDHSSTLGADFFFPMGGVQIASLGTDSATFDVVIDGNYFDEITNASGGVGQLTLAMTNGTWQVLVEDNTFDTPGNAPWFVRADSTVSARLLFRNNVGIKGAFCSPDPSANGGGCDLGGGQLCPGAAGYCGPGLRTLVDLQNGAVVAMTIINDDFAEHDAGFDPGQTFEARVLPTGGGGMLCLDLQNNDAPDGYSLEEFAGDFDLIGSGTCPVGSPSAGCQTVLGNRGNRGGGNSPTTVPPFVNVEAGSTIDVVAGACQQPSGPIF